MKATDVSVVIPVRNGASTISEQLDALLRQSTRATWEVVIADNGSTDATVELIRDHALFESGVVTIVDAGDRPGVNTARNTGIAASCAPIVLLCDADDAVGVDWIHDHHINLVEHPNTLAAGPLRAMPDTDGRVAGWALELAEPGQLESGAPFGWGGNMAFQRTVWEQLGGFDADVAIYFDDVDFFARAFDHGVPFIWIAGAIVEYRPPASRREMLRKAVRAGRGETRWRRANPHHGAARGRGQLTKVIIASLPLLVADLARRREAHARVRQSAYRLGQLLG